MKIVVIGGSGLIGSKLVEKLREDGHDPLAASPDSGVDTLTGEGLAEALEGAEVVVDVSNASVWDDAAMLDFFQTSSRNILAAETAAGVGHHVALSVVGADRLPDSGYLRAKVAQEEAINITLYWLTNTGVSASRLYWEYRGGFFNAKGVSIPVAVSVFPGEQYQAPRSWTERAYPNLIYYRKLDKGGHFAAWEQPQLFSEEVRAAFTSLR